jgi:radical SAM superfamily enzyme YgiQ (UPF0313 family)
MIELQVAYGADHIWFSDDVFALNRHWVQDFALAVERRGKAVPFKVQTRADLMTAATVEALRRAGCAEVWMGVESGSQEILEAMDKGLKIEQVSSARQHLLDSEIRACYFLQLGYPGETWADIQKTIALLRATRPDDIGVSVSYPLPNTVFYEKVQAQLGPKRNWTDSEDLCAMFKATYADAFYHALRDALHAEVNSWQAAGTHADGSTLAELWKRVIELESVSRNPDATNGWLDDVSAGDADFVPVRQLLRAARKA